MGVAVITGSSGLIGSEAALHFGSARARRRRHRQRHAQHVLRPRGLDRVERRAPRAIARREATPTTTSTSATATRSSRSSRGSARAIELVIHAAAQPSHDWAAREPFTDFDINAVGTLNLLEATRLHAPEADVHLHLDEQGLRRPPELAAARRARDALGDRPRATRTATASARTCRSTQSLHSLFGASKVAADVLVQEYGRYFGMRTACFRGGTLTGPHHSAAELHGFLAYVMRCVMTGTPYTVFGYKGKQVRDAIHSHDLIRAFDEFFRAPRVAEVYNIGGGRFSNCSVLEAIDAREEIAGDELDWTYADDEPRRRPHLVDRRQRPVPVALSRTGGWSTTFAASSRRSSDANAERWRPGVVSSLRARPPPAPSASSRLSRPPAAWRRLTDRKARTGRSPRARVARQVPSRVGPGTRSRGSPRRSRRPGARGSRRGARPARPAARLAPAPRRLHLVSRLALRGGGGDDRAPGGEVGRQLRGQRHVGHGGPLVDKRTSAASGSPPIARHLQLDEVDVGESARVRLPLKAGAVVAVPTSAI